MGCYKSLRGQYVIIGKPQPTREAAEKLRDETTERLRDKLHLSNIAGLCCSPGHCSRCWLRIIGLPTKSIRSYPNKIRPTAGGQRNLPTLPRSCCVYPIPAGPFNVRWSVWDEPKRAQWKKTHRYTPLPAILRVPNNSPGKRHFPAAVGRG